MDHAELVLSSEVRIENVEESVHQRIEELMEDSRGNPWTAERRPRQCAFEATQFAFTSSQEAMNTPNGVAVEASTVKNLNAGPNLGVFLGKTFITPERSVLIHCNRLH